LTFLSAERPGEAMKVAVSAKGTDLDAAVDERFGRAQGFVLVDADSWAFEHVPNAQNLEAAQGAGIQAARLVADRGAEVVISGHVGPKAFRTLSAAGVKMVTGATGTVREAVEAFRAGRLVPARGADVEGHW
jgi:predicted Fe-Mo cluster-binding NifX family protein